MVCRVFCWFTWLPSCKDIVRTVRSGWSWCGWTTKLLREILRRLQSKSTILLLLSAVWKRDQVLSDCANHENIYPLRGINATGWSPTKFALGCRAVINKFVCPFAANGHTHLFITSRPPSENFVGDHPVVFIPQRADVGVISTIRKDLISSLQRAKKK